MVHYSFTHINRDYGDPNCSEPLPPTSHHLAARPRVLVSSTQLAQLHPAPEDTHCRAMGSTAGMIYPGNSRSWRSYGKSHLFLVCKSTINHPLSIATRGSATQQMWKSPDKHGDFLLVDLEVNIGILPARTGISPMNHGYRFVKNWDKTTQRIANLLILENDDHEIVGYHTLSSDQP